MATQKQMKEAGLKISPFGNMKCKNNCQADFIITKRSVVECASCGKQFGTLFTLNKDKK